MKEFMKGISMLKPIPDGSMKMAQEALPGFRLREPL